MKITDQMIDSKISKLYHRYEETDDEEVYETIVILRELRTLRLENKLLRQERNNGYTTN
jgi:hypothetical protein